MVDGNVGEWKSTEERRSHCEMSMNDTFGFDFSWGSYRDNLSKSYDLVVFFWDIKCPWWFWIFTDHVLIQSWAMSSWLQLSAKEGTFWRMKKWV